MMRHLNNARLDLRRALEENPGSSELDPVTRLILEAVRAICAARREALTLRPGGGGRRRGGVRVVDHRHYAARGGDRPELKVVRSGTTETDRMVVAGLESDVVRAALRARACPEQLGEGAA